MPVGDVCGFDMNVRYGPLPPMDPRPIYRAKPHNVRKVSHVPESYPPVA